MRENWYVAASVLLPFFRVLRLARALVLLRSLSLSRVLLSASRVTRAISDITGGRNIGFVLATVVFFTSGSAAAVFFFERGDPASPFHSFGDAFWWAATMVTTINIGADQATLEGRVSGILLRVFGLSVFGYLTATFATYFIGPTSLAKTQAGVTNLAPPPSSCWRGWSAWRRGSSASASGSSEGRTTLLSRRLTLAFSLYQVLTARTWWGASVGRRQEWRCPIRCDFTSAQRWLAVRHVHLARRTRRA